MAKTIHVDGIISMLDVESAYRGKNDACCCGCSGTHVNVDEDRETVVRYVRRIEKLIREGRADIICSTFVSAVSDTGRLYIAYFKKRDNNCLDGPAA